MPLVNISARTFVMCILSYGILIVSQITQSHTRKVIGVLGHNHSFFFTCLCAD